MSGAERFAELEARVDRLERIVEDTDDKRDLDDKHAVRDEVAALNLRLAAVTEWVADVAAGAS